ncbi:MAG: peptidyl-prolyl cis-trans isomerase [Pontiella sp.]
MSKEAMVDVDERKPPILVNGETVSDELIQQELEVLRDRYSQEMSSAEMDAKQDKIDSDARENAVERILLIQKARTKNHDVRPEEIDMRFLALKEQHGGEDEFGKQFELSDEDVEKIKANIDDGIRLEKYFDELCENAEYPEEEDGRAYYEAHQDEFKIPAMVRVAQIVRQPSPELPVEKVYAALLNIRERLLAGEDFDTVARVASRGSDNSHELGFFARGQMIPAFEEVAFNTKVGEFSDVFQTEFGYHVLIVREHKSEVIRPYEEVRYDIENIIFDERKNKVIGAVADELRAHAHIQNLEIVEG